MLFLDAQHRLIALEELFRGTLTQTSVYPREVVHARAAPCTPRPWCWRTTTRAACVEPSRADEALTQTLKAKWQACHFDFNGKGRVMRSTASSYRAYRA